MKTETRSKIVKIVEKEGKIRPVQLREKLNISPQALHRHLRALTLEGILESKGSSPFTEYVLAGVPDLGAVAHWLNAKTAANNPESVCETREIFAARLPRLKNFLLNGLSNSLLPLVIATSGEIGNNSFDHNLGQWRDVPGCWFEPQMTGKHLWVAIADRGQGIFQSLAKAHPDLKDEQVALKAAFETIISGRSPEKRGNGLKYVRESVSKIAGCGIACISGNGHVSYGEQGEQCAGSLRKNFREVRGTITLMAWGLK